MRPQQVRVVALSLDPAIHYIVAMLAGIDAQKVVRLMSHPCPAEAANVAQEYVGWCGIAALQSQSATLALCALADRRGVFGLLGGLAGL